MTRIDEIIERPKQHWDEDGAADLMLGLSVFLLGAGWWFEGRPLLSAIIIVPACLWGLKILKERVISPRAGYVALRHPSDVGAGPLKSRLLVQMLWVALLSVMFLMPGYVWTGYTGISWVWWARHDKAPRYLWLAGLSFALAGWMYLTHASMEKIYIVLTWVGGCWALMGAIRLRDFLATHPRVEDHG